MKHPPTWRLFGGELRRARKAAGMTQQQLADTIQYSTSLVALVEQARRCPSPDFSRRCDNALPTDGLLERIWETIAEETYLPWFRQWVQLEQEAVALRCFESMVVPGLLQTEDYARAILVGAGRFSIEDVEAQVLVRIERQAVLTRKPPPRFVAVLDENVLRRPVGTGQVMHDQMMRLTELADLPHIHIHVVPIEAGAYAGFNGPFVIATLPGGDNVAYIDNQLQGHIVHKTEDVLSLQHSWEALRAEALPHRQSMDMIMEAAKSWT